MKKIWLACVWLFMLLFIIPAEITAQDKNNRFGIGMYLSTYEFQGDLGSEFFRFRDVQGGGGVAIQYYLSSWFDLGFGIHSGTFNFFDSPSYIRGRAISTTLDIKLKLYNDLIIREDAFIGPYLLLGGGFADVSSRGIDKSNNYFTIEKSDGTLDFGGGIRFRINDNFSALIQTRQFLPLIDDFDAIEGKDKYLEHSIGLIFMPFGSKDSDKDGISDSRDRCPGTPAGTPVDKFGCPIEMTDTLYEKSSSDDQDGRIELIDRTLDSDGDGIPDYIDYCPTDFGPAEFNGCPDSDGDGIVDIYDECPGTPDGINVNYKGCPLDRDKDGIPDSIDKCPNTPGTPEREGCPEVEPIVEEMILLAAKNIQFETGSSELTSASKKSMEDLTLILRTNPSIKLRIAGHTDAQGDDDKNMILSQQRADATKAYLVAKGFSSDRFTSVGFGETKPVSSNDSSTGRAQNRRVEFIILK
jgi:OmpA-OmpF porin, OOP family